MPAVIKLIRLTAAELKENFNSLSIVLFHTHLCSKLLLNLPVYTSTDNANRQAINAIIERIRAYFWCLAKYDFLVNLPPSPGMEILCITIIHNTPEQTADIVLAQFDLTADGLATLHPTNVLAFLTILLREGITCVRSFGAQPRELDRALANCLY